MAAESSTYGDDGSRSTIVILLRDRGINKLPLILKETSSGSGPPSDSLWVVDVLDEYRKLLSLCTRVRNNERLRKQITDTVIKNGGGCLMFSSLLRIGRIPKSNHIAFKDTSVSGHHATLSWQIKMYLQSEAASLDFLFSIDSMEKEGAPRVEAVDSSMFHKIELRMWVKDLSTNGTFVNGIKLHKHANCSLTPPASGEPPEAFHIQSLGGPNSASFDEVSDFPFKTDCIVHFGRLAPQQRTSAALQLVLWAQDCEVSDLSTLPILGKCLNTNSNKVCELVAESADIGGSSTLFKVGKLLDDVHALDVSSGEESDDTSPSVSRMNITHHQTSIHSVPTGGGHHLSSAGDFTHVKSELADSEWTVQRKQKSSPPTWRFKYDTFSKMSSTANCRTQATGGADLSDPGSVDYGLTSRSVKQELKRLEQRLEECENEKLKLVRELARNAEQKEDMTTSETLTKEVMSLRESIEEYKTELEIVKSRNVTLKNQLFALTKERDELRGERERQNNECEELNLRRKQSLEQLRALKLANKELDDSLKDSKKQLEEERSQRIQEIETLKFELKREERKYEAAGNQLKNIEATYGDKLRQVVEKHEEKEMMMLHKMKDMESELRVCEEKNIQLCRCLEISQTRMKTLGGKFKLWTKTTKSFISDLQTKLDEGEHEVELACSIQTDSNELLFSKSKSDEWAAGGGGAPTSSSNLLSTGSDTKQQHSRRKQQQQLHFNEILSTTTTDGVVVPADSPFHLGPATDQTITQPLVEIQTTATLEAEKTDEDEPNEDAWVVTTPVIGGDPDDVSIHVACVDANNNKLDGADICVPIKTAKRTALRSGAGLATEDDSIEDERDLTADFDTSGSPTVRPKAAAKRRKKNV